MFLSPFAMRTFAILDLSHSAFLEIKSKLEDAGYQHAFTKLDGRPAVDMHGIAVREIEPGMAWAEPASYPIKSDY